LMPYLHLPVQSGSDKILKAMNRKHTAADYLRVIDKIRAVRPDIALSGDFIVGFPGETDADFADTMALCEQVRYAQAYSFKYSPRPGTPAAERSHVNESEKSKRLAQLQELLGQHQADFQNAMIGKTVPVLLEKPGRMPGQMVGKSASLHAVHMTADSNLSGQIVQARILWSDKNSLAAEIV